MSNENEDKGTGITSQSYMQEQHEAQMESWLDFVWDNKDSATFSVDTISFNSLSKALNGDRNVSRSLQFSRNGETMHIKRGLVGTKDGTSVSMLHQRNYVRLSQRTRKYTVTEKRRKIKQSKNINSHYYIPLLWDNWRKEYREKNNYKIGFHLRKDEAVHELKVMADFLEDQYISEKERKYNEEKRRKKNPEQMRAKRRRYYAENREKLNAKQRKYYEKNREHLIAKQRKYYEKNREHLNAKNRIYQRKYRAKKKEE